MAGTITKTCLNICEIDSQYPDSTNTSSCDVGYYTGKVNNCFFNFDSVNDEIPSGSVVTQALLKLAQVSGGYTAQQNIYITLRSGSWYVMTWNNQAPDAGAGTVSVYLSGSSAGTRSFNITSLIQWIVNNNSSAHIIKLARNPNTTTGTLDAKRFSTTASNHQLEITYVAPPNAPTGLSATRVSDTQANLSWTNNATTERPYDAIQILRSTDDASFVQIQQISGSSTGYSDTTITANHRYRYRVCAVNTAGSATSASSGYVYTTPAAPSNVVATKTGGSSATITWTDNANSEEYFELQRRVDSGSWTTLTSTIAADTTSYNDTSVPSGTIDYRLRAYRGSLYSDWSDPSNTIATSAPPNAPTVVAWPAYSPTGSALRIQWTHNPTDGSEQTAADIYYTIGGTPTTYNLTGSQNYYDIPISGVSAATVVTGKVRTYGMVPNPGAYSSTESTTLADAPEVTITNPPSDDYVVDEPPLVVTWTYSDEFSQASWNLKLYKSGVLQNTWTGTTETSQEIGLTYLPDDSSFSLRLTVYSASGRYTTATRTFTTDYLGPTEPTVYATFDSDTFSVHVQGYAGETGSLPGTDHLALQRIETYDGVETTTTIADPLPEGAVVVDYVPRLGVTVTYRLLAVAASGAASYSDAEVETPASGAFALNWGDGNAELLVLTYAGRATHRYDTDSESYVFASREKPVLYAGEHTFERISVSALVADNAAGEVASTLRQLATNRGAVVYREPLGYRENVAIVGYQYQPSPLVRGYAISLDLEVVE